MTQPNMLIWLSTIHFAVTWALVGLIWTIQLVAYPLFAQVGQENFRTYHASHTRQITWIVAPLIGLEFLSALLLVTQGARAPWFLASLVLLIFNLVSTWRVQVPLHERLAKGFDADAHGRLVATNWWRTAAWTLRGGLLLLGIV